MVEQFNKLQQTGFIEEYIDDFKNLRSLMEQFNHVLPDTYLLESFIRGLKLEIKVFVKSIKPSTVTESTTYARIHADIFKEPDELPPKRRMFDPRIPLQKGANSVNIRPYRYPLK